VPEELSIIDIFCFGAAATTMTMID